MKKDILERILKTFIQGFLGSLIVFMNTNSQFDEALLKSAITGGLSGGISAVMNLTINLIKESEE